MEKLLLPLTVKKFREERPTEEVDPLWMEITFIVGVALVQAGSQATRVEY